MPIDATINNTAASAIHKGRGGRSRMRGELLDIASSISESRLELEDLLPRITRICADEEHEKTGRLRTGRFDPTPTCFCKRAGNARCERTRLNGGNCCDPLSSILSFPSALFSAERVTDASRGRRSRRSFARSYSSIRPTAENTPVRRFPRACRSVSSVSGRSTCRASPVRRRR